MRVHKKNSVFAKWDRNDSFVHLVEEVGELAEIIMQYNRKKPVPKTRRDIEIALIDIVEEVQRLAKHYKISKKFHL